ncbi:MAG: hypothetical protein ACYTG1_08500 [Planctomycetota bacterium]|jgi:hypothetical protein
MRRLPVILVLVLACAAPARGQGTSGILPDPIASRDLARLLAPLELSGQQRQAIDAFHDEYLAEFRVLRDGEIETFMSSAEAIRRGFGFLSDRKTIEDAVREYRRLLGRIERLDERLLDAVQTVLTDGQAAWLPRIRDARRRTRWDSGMARMAASVNPAAHVELGDLLEEARLTGAERDAVDPLLLAYEPQLTRLAGRFHDEVTDLPMVTARRLEEAGFTREALAVRENRGRLFAMFRSAWAEGNRRIAARTAEMNELNRRTLDRLVAVVEPATGRRLRRAFLRRGYAEIARGTGGAARRFALALESDDLSPEERELLAGLAERLFADTDRLTREMIDVAEEDRRSRSVLGFGGGRGDPDFEERLQALRGRLRQVETEAEAALVAAIGKERLDELVREGLRRRGSRPTGVAATPETGAAAGATTTDGLPTPLGAADVDRVARVLGVSADDRLVLDALHEGYRHRWGETVGPRADDARRVRAAFWAAAAEGRADATSVRSAHESERGAWEAAFAADDAFFDDVAAAFGIDEERVRRARDHRRRDLYRAGLDRSPPGPGEGAPGQYITAAGLSGSRTTGLRLDLGVLVERIDPGGRTDEFEATLAEYEQALTAALAAAWEAQRELTEASDLFGVESLRPGPDGRRTVRYGAAYRRLNDTVFRAARDRRAAVETLNRETAERLFALLEGDAGHDLRMAWRRAADPDVFDDPESADGLLRHALALPDLTEDQRVELQQTAAEYRGGYGQCCDRMAEAIAAHADARRAGTPRERVEARRRREQDLSRLRFERDDLTAKTRSRIRAILTEGQWDRVAAGDAPDAADATGL